MCRLLTRSLARLLALRLQGGDEDMGEAEKRQEGLATQDLKKSPKGVRGLWLQWSQLQGALPTRRSSSQLSRSGSENSPPPMLSLYLRVDSFSQLAQLLPENMSGGTVGCAGPRVREDIREERSGSWGGGGALAKKILLPQRSRCRKGRELPGSGKLPEMAVPGEGA
jgi:hypothetical protein